MVDIFAKYSFIYDEFAFRRAFMAACKSHGCDTQGKFARQFADCGKDGALSQDLLKKVFQEKRTPGLYMVARAARLFGVSAQEIFVPGSVYRGTVPEDALKPTPGIFVFAPENPLPQLMYDLSQDPSPLTGAPAKELLNYVAYFMYLLQANALGPLSRAETCYLQGFLANYMGHVSGGVDGDLLPLGSALADQVLANSRAKGERILPREFFHEYHLCYDGMDCHDRLMALWELSGAGFCIEYGSGACTPVCGTIGTDTFRGISRCRMKRALCLALDEEGVSSRELTELTGMKSSQVALWRNYAEEAGFPRNPQLAVILRRLGMSLDDLFVGQTAEINGSKVRRRYSAFLRWDGDFSACGKEMGTGILNEEQYPALLKAYLRDKKVFDSAMLDFLRGVAFDAVDFDATAEALGALYLTSIGVDAEQEILPLRADILPRYQADLQAWHEADDPEAPRPFYTCAQGDAVMLLCYDRHPELLHDYYLLLDTAERARLRACFKMLCRQGQLTKKRRVLAEQLEMDA